MVKAAFITLRVLTAIASLAALAGTILAILFSGFFTFLKEGAGVIVSVVKLFASGFRNSDPPQQSQHLLSLPLVALAILFFTMFASVFFPCQRIFLHIVATMAATAAVYRIWTMVAQHDSQLLYLPILALWFIYYAVCLRRA